MLTVPPLVDGGVMLSYKCTNTCRHCAYRCSPHRPDEWLEGERLDATFRALSTESELQSVHLAGGEAMLRLDLVIEAVRAAVRHGVRLSYLETNASWCTDPQTTREKFNLLRKAGLRAVLISVSPFHNEFIPFRRTQIGVEGALEVFGPEGVIVWVPEMFRTLSQLPADTTRSLELFLTATGLKMRHVPQIYPLTVHGRVTEELREAYSARPAEVYRQQTCQAELTSTAHFHIDRHGCCFVGQCPGIIASTIDRLHPRMEEQTHPTYLACYHRGPFGLMELAAGEYGYRERGEGYISKCDLCFDVRRHLVGREAFPDIGPQEFYA
jgi:hypothetical protein